MLCAGVVPVLGQPILPTLHTGLADLVAVLEQVCDHTASKVALAEGHQAHHILHQNVVWPQVPDKLQEQIDVPVVVVLLVKPFCIMWVPQHEPILRMRE